MRWVGVAGNDSASAELSSGRGCAGGELTEEVGFGDDRVFDLVEEHTLVGTVDVHIVGGAEQGFLGNCHREGDRRVCGRRAFRIVAIGQSLTEGPPAV